MNIKMPIKYAHFFREKQKEIKIFNKDPTAKQII